MHESEISLLPPQKPLDQFVCHLVGSIHSGGVPVPGNFIRFCQRKGGMYSHP